MTTTETSTDQPVLAASDFTPKQEDLVLDLPKTFETAEEERKHRKERLAAALRIIGGLGFAEGVAGHITARDPELTDHFWVNPFGMSFNRVTVSDLILVNPEGIVVHGNRPVNAAAFAIHHAIHEARPDVIAAVHTHTVYGRAFSSLGKDVAMLTQDACMFYNDVALHADSGGAVVTGAEDGAGLAASLGDKKALIHRNHGLITVGGSVDAAAWWFIALERCCQVQLIAEAAGEPMIIPDEYAQTSWEQTGHELAGWFQFQPHLADLLAADPSFLG
ncbi:MAG: class II aldolase/adducin family protein [Actinomycetota bacterium]